MGEIQIFNLIVFGNAQSNDAEMLWHDGHLFHRQFLYRQLGADTGDCLADALPAPILGYVKVRELPALILDHLKKYQQRFFLL